MPPRMPIETKALFASTAAGLAVVGASFGLAAIMRSSMSDAASSPSVINNPTNSSTGGINADAAQIVQGHAFYTQSCSACHGVGGQGGDGPSLIGLGLDDAEIVETIRDGIKGDMPAFGQKYQKSQVQTIIAYIHSLKKPSAKKPLP